MPNTMNSDFKPAQLDIDIVYGDTWVEEFDFTINSLPIDLSTATININITNCQNVVSWNATNGNGITITGTDHNKVIVSKDVTITAGNYIWELVVEYANNVVKTYLWGDFNVYANKNQQ
jgi:hypothetical protein